MKTISICPGVTNIRHTIHRCHRRIDVRDHTYFIVLVVEGLVASGEYPHGARRDYENTVRRPAVLLFVKADP